MKAYYNQPGIFGLFSSLEIVYNRTDEVVDGHQDWQLTAVDFRTGYRGFIGFSSDP